MTAKKKKPLVSTVAKARAFLAAYRRSCNITASAKAARIQPRQHYRWLEKYPRYAAAFERAKVVAAQYLEDVCIKRATLGWEEPIFYQGDICGTVTRFDGGLAQFLLRGAMPEKYNRTAVELSGPSGKPIRTSLEVVFVKPDDSAVSE